MRRDMVTRIRSGIRRSMLAAGEQLRTYLHGTNIQCKQGSYVAVPSNRFSVIADVFGYFQAELAAG